MCGNCVWENVCAGRESVSATQSFLLVRALIKDGLLTPGGLGAANVEVNLASLVCLVSAVCDSQDQHRGVQVMCSKRLLMLRM